VACRKKKAPCETSSFPSSKDRNCPGCGIERQEIGAEDSWQIPGRFEHIRPVCKKYACVACEKAGENPRMEVAAKPETAIDKGMAGPGLLACIITSKFSDYLPLYRREDIFARQAFEISRATQSIWCGDVADLVTPLYELMGQRVRQSHVAATDDTIMPMLSPGKRQSARMCVYVGDVAHPYNAVHFTLNRRRRVRKSRQKETGRAAHAGVMQIEWSDGTGASPHWRHWNFDCRALSRAASFQQRVSLHDLR
jgi:transposase